MLPLVADASSTEPLGGRPFRQGRSFAQFGIVNSGQVRRVIANGGPQLSTNGHRLPRLRCRGGREVSVGKREECGLTVSAARWPLTEKVMATRVHGGRVLTDER